MKRVKVNAVNGTMINADGKWLYCIGNIPVRVGDYIWTDGRCVYGNVMEAGEPFIILNSENEKGIPLLARNLKPKYFGFFNRKKIKTIKRVNLQNCEGLVNNKNKCVLINKKDYGENFQGVLDAEISNNGDIYLLETVHFDEEKAALVGGNIFKNGKKTANYLDNLKSEISKIESEAKLEEVYSQFAIDSGFIDKDGSYTVFCLVQAFGSADTATQGDWDQSIIHELDHTTMITSYRKELILKPKENTTLITSSLRSSRVEIELNSYNINVADHSIKIPLPDNWYYTFAFPEKMRQITGIDTPTLEFSEDAESLVSQAIIFPDSFSFQHQSMGNLGKYEIKIYNEKDIQQLTLKYNYFPFKILLHSIYAEKFLIEPSERGFIEIVNKNGDILDSPATDKKFDSPKYISYTDNYRFREMKDINKYKKEISKYQKS